MDKRLTDDEYLNVISKYDVVHFLYYEYKLKTR